MPETVIYILGYTAVFLFGIVIGSFCNVCIYRIPKQESIMVDSHCMNCGEKLHWYDLVPLFSFIILKGRCRKCQTKLSLQYPLIEGMNGALYVVVILANGWNLLSVIYCLLTSALIVLSVIDFRTYLIPNQINAFILALGIITVILDREHATGHMIGMVGISGFLLILYLLTAGRGIGGGDIKLMAAAGLITGWQISVLSFLTGCILGSVVHLIRMKISGVEHKLALGPYLSVGIWISLLFGSPVIHWYLQICGLE